MMFQGRPDIDPAIFGHSQTVLGTGCKGSDSQAHISYFRRNVRYIGQMSLSDD